VTTPNGDAQPSQQKVNASAKAAVVDADVGVVAAAVTVPRGVR